MKKFKKICIGAISLATIFSGVSAFAVQDYNLTTTFTEDYVKWQSLTEEEKEKTIIPRISTIGIPEEFNFEGISSCSGLREQVTSGKFLKNAKTALVAANGYQLSKYNLNDDKNVTINVKHQGDTNECWAFSMTSVLETNLALTQNIQKTFSPRHMDYSSIRTFTDGVNIDNLNREAGQGGLAQFAVAYLTNGKGAILESQMPFEDNENIISLDELNKPVDTIATETVTFPSLYKRYAVDDGEVIYTNGATGDALVIYENEEVQAFRNAIKNHIVKYGAISAVTAGNEIKYYSNPTSPEKSSAYFCNDSSVIRDHAITIVGWDDNYSKDNFTGAAKPTSDGAYICLNSYGTENFQNGYLYISYEDSLIETYLYGIKSTSLVDYDKIYQYNPTGSNTSVALNNVSKGYISQVFDRDASKKETLKYVGIDLPADMSLKIYVNPTGNNPVLSACTLVATTEKLSAGYHRIPIEAVNLTGSKFAVVVEEISENGSFEFAIEIAFKDSIYSTILGNPGKCLFSSNGYSWASLASQNVSGFDMTTADTTIKAFVSDGYVNSETPEEPEEPGEPEEPTNPIEDDKITIDSTVYTIQDTDIYKIAHETTIKDFKKNITTNSTNIEFYDSTNKKLEETEIIKNGTKMKLSDGTIYILIVRGDTNSDGTLTLVDLSQIVGHYGDENKHGLTGNAKKAADLNVDGKITLTDISQMVNILGHL